MPFNFLSGSPTIRARFSSATKKKGEEETCGQHEKWTVSSSTTASLQVAQLYHQIAC